jgi:hypothetical protein
MASRAGSAKASAMRAKPDCTATGVKRFTKPLQGSTLPLQVSLCALAQRNWHARRLRHFIAS